MSQASPRSIPSDSDVASLNSIHQIDNSSVLPEGTMQDIELSSRRMPVEGLFGWLKPWFHLTDQEFGERCTSCVFPYRCLDLTCMRLLDMSMNELRLRSGDFLYALGMPRLFCEESLDVSTASVASNPFPRGEDDASPPSGDMLSNGVDESSLGLQMTGSSEGCRAEHGLGVLEGYCNKSHPVYATMRRMWDNPDLYALLWINVLTAGSLFMLYSVYNHVTGVGDSLVSLITLYNLITICVSCSVLMCVGIVLCHGIVCGTFDRALLLPTLCGCGYMQIPLTLATHFSVWSRGLCYYIPFLSLLFGAFRLVTILHVCAATVSTVVLYVPAVANPSQDMKFKVSSALLTCTIQVCFFFWIESYM
ncbi:hypothetical protein X943_001693 [Babesia divergens]|uniref:Uncharacterized protein n=1 Tax=Babesia divergens TaxID=32595 RepID=A0AAD9G704_BABDI|nr:hypothetical protein X943_001693 [Babesia divergens]